jgi:hypothetical protein
MIVTKTIKKNAIKKIDFLFSYVPITFRNEINICTCNQSIYACDWNLIIQTKRYLIQSVFIVINSLQFITLNKKNPNILMSSYNHFPRVHIDVQSQGLYWD